MKIFNLLMSGKMEWLGKLKDLEDTSAGIYIKARASILERDKACKFYSEGLLAEEYDLNEIDEAYIQELEDIGYIRTETRGKKLILILGEDYQWYTDGPKRTNEQMDFIKLYSKLCSEYDIPNNAVNEPKTHKLIKVIRSYENWESKLEFVFKNWKKHLSKELNTSLPTLNVLASQYYWRRIENVYLNKPVTENIGNRYGSSAEDSEFEFKRPTIR
jgi:hypothetical protein